MTRRWLGPIALLAACAAAFGMFLVLFVKVVAWMVRTVGYAVAVLIAAAIVGRRELAAALADRRAGRQPIALYPCRADETTVDAALVAPVDDRRTPLERLVDLGHQIDRSNHPR